MAESYNRLQQCFGSRHQFISSSEENELKVRQVIQQHYTDTRLKEKLFGLKKPKAALQRLYCNGLDSDQIYEQILLNDADEISLGGELHDTSNSDDTDEDMDERPSEEETDDGFLEQEMDDQVEEEDETDNENEEADNVSEEADNEEEDTDNEKEDTDNEEEDTDNEEEETDNEEEETDEEEQMCDNNTSSKDLESGYDEEAEGGDKSDEDTDSGMSDDEKKLHKMDKEMFSKYKSSSESEDSESEIEDLAIGSAEEDTDDEIDKQLQQDLNNAVEEGSNDDDDSDDNDDDEEISIKKRKVDSSNNSLNNNPLGNVIVPHFGKTSVDSSFFNVRESEWIADEDILGGKHFDDVDFMEDIDEETTEETRYDEFFDTPASIKNKTNKKQQEKPNVAENFDLSETQEASEEDTSSEEETEPDTKATEPCTSQQAKSRLETELESELRLRQHLEESNLADKGWALKGEVRASDRPENSVLTECLEYKSGLRHKPVVDELLTRRIERLVIERYRTSTFDNVERKANITEDAFEYKKRLVLDQEKSQKSLSKIYEDEYLQKQRLDKAKEANEELPEHKAVRESYEELDELLSSLFNAHYIPKRSRAEVKIVSNLPAMRVEEATPIVVADSDVLAPQEILAPQRGEFKGDTERTDTDRKRERRVKKHRQHVKSLHENKNTDAKVKKAAKEGKKLDVDTTTKVVQKAIKVGHVFRMDKQGNSTKSSTSFFKQLQETHTASSNAIAKKRKRGDK